MFSEVEAALHRMDDRDEPPRHRSTRNCRLIAAPVADDLSSDVVSFVFRLRLYLHRLPKVFVILGPSWTYYRNLARRYRRGRGRRRIRPLVIKIVFLKICAKRMVLSPAFYRHSIAAALLEQFQVCVRVLHEDITYQLFGLDLGKTFSKYCVRYLLEDIRYRISVLSLRKTFSTDYTHYRLLSLLNHPGHWNLRATVSV